MENGNDCLHILIYASTFSGSLWYHLSNNHQLH